RVDVPEAGGEAEGAPPRERTVEEALLENHPREQSRCAWLPGDGGTGQNRPSAPGHKRCCSAPAGARLLPAHPPQEPRTPPPPARRRGTSCAARPPRLQRSWATHLLPS